MNDYSLSGATPRAERAEKITTREATAPLRKTFGMDDALMSDRIAISRRAPSSLMLARATRQRETNDLPGNTICESKRGQRDL